MKATKYTESIQSKPKKEAEQQASFYTTPILHSSMDFVCPLTINKKKKKRGRANQKPHQPSLRSQPFQKSTKEETFSPTETLFQHHEL